MKMKTYHSLDDLVADLSVPCEVSVNVEGEFVAFDEEQTTLDGVYHVDVVVDESGTRATVRDFTTKDGEVLDAPVTAEELEGFSWNI